MYAVAGDEGVAGLAGVAGLKMRVVLALGINVIVA